ncbi:MAG: AraC family transcriptional regulator [Ignavibacteriales bacterium]|nr:AraC family transcriptional regulator [Ignavibacteriales bacterium]
MITYEINELDSFQVIGIKTRTTNKNNLAITEIGELWEYFMNDDIGSKIPNKLSEDMYCLYTEYESDATGLYTAILGKKVANLDEIPEGMIGITIPPQKYRIYTSKGKLSECVSATWIQIWSEKIERSYTVDYDLYGEKAFDPEKAEVKTFLAIN